MRLLAGERHQDPTHHVIGARAEETGAQAWMVVVRPSITQRQRCDARARHHF
jgi:hypothetical protein